MDRELIRSHLLARRGQAEHIGNLVGHFEFTDEQLAATQKGLQGVAMPNFGDAKATLAKEASWEPEEPEETEEEGVCSADIASSRSHWASLTCRTGQTITRERRLYQGTAAPSARSYGPAAHRPHPCSARPCRT